MLTIFTIIAVFYVTIATVVFFAYDDEPLRIRAMFCVVAPVLLAVAGVKWLVSWLEELG